MEDRFHKEFIGLPRSEQKKVLRALADLKDDPMRDSRPLKGYPGIFRRRVDTYRILFAMTKTWVHVYSVQHRRSVYSGVLAQPSTLPATDPDAWPDLGDVSREPELVLEPEHAAAPFDWDAVAALVISQDAEQLYQLIGHGLPEPLFDELYQFLKAARKSPSQALNIRLVRERVIDEFYGPLFLIPERINPIELTIVAPWLTSWEGVRSSYTTLLAFLRLRKPRTTIITRPPLMPAHRRCMEELGELPRTEIVELDDLHAKFFICEMPPAPFALIGSANTTAQSLVNYEVGVFIRGSGPAEAIVRDLQGLAVELRAAGKRTKRRALA